MLQNWAEKITEKLVSRRLIQKGICLILGAVDTGKTSLAAKLAGSLAKNQPVAFIDADIGQSHIGPPSTIGWAIINTPQVMLSQLRPEGISFVGHVTPIGHLLQFTTALAQCVRQATQLTKIIIIDTPGFVRHPAAAALWWSVQRILSAELILAVQRGNELDPILDGLKHFDATIEMVKCPPEIPVKTPQHRKRYRRRCFYHYFKDSQLYDIKLNEVSVQSARGLLRDDLTGRLVALRDNKGIDIAVGRIEKFSTARNLALLRAPKLNVKLIKCLVIGEISISAPDREDEQ